MPDTEVIHIFTRGEHVKHPAGNFTVDDAFVQTFIESFNDFYGSRDYKPPILRGHKEEGVIFGIVKAVDATDTHVRAFVEYAAGMREMRENGMILNWSPSFYTAFKDGDDVYPYLLRELSFVSIPHLKSLPYNSESHYRLLEVSEDLVCVNREEIEMSKTEKKATVLNPLGEEVVKNEEPSIEERLKAIEEEIMSLSAWKKSMEESEEEEPSENDEDKEDEEDKVHENGESLETLKLEIESLRKQVHAYELREQGIPTEKADRLYRLRETDADLYEEALTLLKGQAGDKSGDKVLSVPKGRSGAPTGKPGKDQLIQMAEEQGLKGAEKLNFLESHGVKF
jgi:hypothetical protein